MSKPDHGNTETDVPPPPGKGPFLLAALVVAGLVGWGAYGHQQKAKAAAETQRKTLTTVPKMRTVEAKRLDGPIDVTLPGQTEAFATARIFPRATGYIAERFVDIGSRVKTGELLLRIAAPDLDQQLVQAEANLGQLHAQLVRSKALVDQAKANVNLAKVTNARTSTLAGQGWATQQNADTTQASVLSQQATLASNEADVKVAEANIKAQQATVDRLKALTGFERILAPFDGVITSRNVDIGDLVQADAGSGVALLSMDQDDLLRVSVNVPQNAAVGVHSGVKAEIKVPQMPGQSFSGEVARSSVALLASSRTLRTQVDVPNKEHVLRPGLFIYVTLKIPRTSITVSVPSEAMVFNQRGTQVLVARQDGTGKWVSIQIERDRGATIEVNQGLDGGEQIVLSPPPDFDDGTKIEIEPKQDGSAAMKSAER